MKSTFIIYRLRLDQKVGLMKLTDFNLYKFEPTKSIMESANEATKHINQLQLYYNFITLLFMQDNFHVIRQVKSLLRDRE